MINCSAWHAHNVHLRAHALVHVLARTKLTCIQMHMMDTRKNSSTQIPLSHDPSLTHTHSRFNVRIPSRFDLPAAVMSLVVKLLFPFNNVYRLRHLSQRSIICSFMGYSSLPLNTISLGIHQTLTSSVLAGAPPVSLMHFRDLKVESVDPCWWTSHHDHFIQCVMWLVCPEFNENDCWGLERACLGMVCLYYSCATCEMNKLRTECPTRATLPPIILLISPIIYLFI